jgi:hypothetical protein
LPRILLIRRILNKTEISVVNNPEKLKTVATIPKLNKENITTRNAQRHPFLFSLFCRFMCL